MLVGVSAEGRLARAQNAPPPPLRPHPHELCSSDTFFGPFVILVLHLCPQS